MNYAFAELQAIRERGPQAGEVCFSSHCRPQEEASSVCTDLLECGRDALVFGQGMPERILIPVDDLHPHLDDMLAVSMLRSKLKQRRLPPGMRAFAAYASEADACQPTGELPLERSLLGIFLATRQREPWGTDNFSRSGLAESFLRAWLRLEARIFECARTKAEPTRDLLFDSAEAYPERAWLLADRDRFQRDLVAARRWRCDALGGAPLVYLPQARSRLAAHWARELRPEVRGLIAVQRDLGGWELYGAHEHSENIDAVCAALQEAETAAGGQGNSWQRPLGQRPAVRCRSTVLAEPIVLGVLEHTLAARSEAAGTPPDVQQLLEDWPQIFPHSKEVRLIPGRRPRFRTRDSQGRLSEIIPHGLRSGPPVPEDALESGTLTNVLETFRGSDDLRRHRLVLPQKVLRFEWRDQLLTLEVRQAFSLGTLAQWRENQPTIAAEDVLTLITDVADALDLLHKWGFSHGNVRPDTILLDRDLGGLFRARLADPGWAVPASLKPDSAQLPFSAANLSEKEAAGDVLSLALTTAFLVRGDREAPFRDSLGQLDAEALSAAQEANLVSGVGSVWYEGLTRLLLEATDPDPARRPTMETFIRGLVKAGSALAPRCISDPGASSGSATDLGEGAYDSAPISKLERRDGAYQLGALQLKRKLGGGGFGEVFLGWDTRNERQVAVKILGEQSMADKDFVERFQIEAQLCLELDSPYLVKVFEIDVFRGLRYMVMEFVDGWTSADLLGRVQRQGYTGFSELLALQVVEAATRGLLELHAVHIVHRDIKPSNIMVPRDEAGELPLFPAAKLIDLGIAKAPKVGLTVTGSTFGSLGYMPPEQIDSAKHVGPEADVFGMGATLYCLLAGEPPFGGRVAEIVSNTMAGHYPSLQTCRRDTSRDVGKLIARCLAVVPSDRFADASALLTGLEKLRSKLVAGTG